MLTQLSLGNTAETKDNILKTIELNKQLQQFLIFDVFWWGWESCVQRKNVEIVKTWSEPGLLVNWDF